MSSALSNQLDSFLSGLGVTRASQYDLAAQAVQSELDRIQLSATLHSLRHGELVLLAEPQTAALLRYNIDQFRARLDVAVPGAVTKIIIKTGRFSSEPFPAPDGVE